MDHRDIWEWAPPGWHWEVLPSGVRSLVRNPGPVVDPELVWWPPYGPNPVHLEPAPPEVVRRRIRQEDEHVRRYLVALETRPRYHGIWQHLLGPQPGHFLPHMVPCLWEATRRGPGPRQHH